MVEQKLTSKNQKKGMPLDDKGKISSLFHDIMLKFVVATCSDTEYLWLTFSPPSIRLNLDPVLTKWDVPLTLHSPVYLEIISHKERPTPDSWSTTERTSNSPNWKFLFEPWLLRFNNTHRSMDEWCLWAELSWALQWDISGALMVSAWHSWRGTGVPVDGGVGQKGTVKRQSDKNWYNTS